MKKLFQISGFSAFLIIMFINASVDLGHKITIQNILYKSFDGEFLAVMTAVVNMMILLPYILFFSIAGFINDKFSRTKVIRVCAIAGLILAFLITLGYYFGFFYFAFFMTLLLALQSAIYSPAKYGLIKRFVGAENLGAANGLVQGITIVAILLASFLFSLIFEGLVRVGEDISQTLQSIWFIGVILCVCAALEVRYAFKVPYFEATNEIEQFDKRKYFKFIYLRQNLNFVLKNNNILLCTIGLAVFWAISQLLIAVFPAHFKEITGSMNAAYAQMILAMSIVGIVVGSLLAGHYCKRHIEMGIVPFGALGIFLFLIVLSNSSSAFYMVIASFGLGFSGGIFMVPLNAHIQFFTPEYKMGRVLAGSNFVQNIFMLLALVLVILMVKFNLSSRQIFTLSAICVLISALFAIKYLPHLFVRILAIPFLKMGYKVSVDGVENIPQTGGVLLLGNHISWIDWAIVQIAAPRPIKFAMHRSFYELWFLKWFLDIFKVIPIGAGASKTAIESIRQRLNNGEVVALFPEGHISYNGRIDEFQAGFEIAAKDTNAKIIPFYIRGFWGSTFSRADKNYKKMFSKNGKPALRVSFGAPMDINSKAHEVKQKVNELSFFSWEKYLDSLRPMQYNWLKQAKRNPFKRVMVDTTGADVTNFKVITAVILFVNKLTQHIKYDKNVGVILPSSVMGSIINLTLFVMNKISINLNYTLSQENLIKCAQIAELNKIITSRTFVERLKERGFDLETSLGDKLLFLEDIGTQITKQERTKAALKALLFPRFLIEYLYFQKTKINNEATILFSSGSEGIPKGVVLTHKNIMANIKQIADLVNASKNEALLASLPIFHCFGLTVTTYFPLNEGLLSIHVPDPTDAFSVGKMTAKYSASLMFGTSTFFRIYTKNKRLNPLMLSTLRLVVAGAEKLNPIVRQEFKIKFGIEIYEGYGTTETTPVVSINTPNILEPDFFKELIFNKTGSVGLTLSGTVIKIVDPNTYEELENGTEGLILIGGSQVMKEYYKDPAKTNQAIIEFGGVRYYKSGDIGYKDNDGFLFITDRLSRFAKIGGEMISLGAVESALNDIFKEEIIFACTNLNDDKKGEKVVMLYSGEISENEVSQKIKSSNLAPIMQPSVIKQVSEIPVLGSGKINFKGLKDLALNLGL